MAKKLKSNPKTKPKFSMTTLIIIGVIVAVSVGGGYYAYQSMIPVNLDYPVFMAAENVLIKTGVSSDGHYVFSHQSSRGGKQVIQNGMTSPTWTIPKGNLVTIHLINEITNKPSEKSLHNFNIDEFNVHSKNLGYFDTQSITFLADKSGQFTYHCTVHPEMKGLLIIQ